MTNLAGNAPLILHLLPREMGEKKTGDVILDSRAEPENDNEGWEKKPGFGQCQAITLQWLNHA